MLDTDEWVVRDYAWRRFLDPQEVFCIFLWYRKKVEAVHSRVSIAKAFGINSLHDVVLSIGSALQSWLLPSSQGSCRCRVTCVCTTAGSKSRRPTSPNQPHNGSPLLFEHRATFSHTRLIQPLRLHAIMTRSPTESETRHAKFNVEQMFRVCCADGR